MQRSGFQFYFRRTLIPIWFFRRGSRFNYTSADEGKESGTIANSTFYIIIKIPRSPKAICDWSETRTQHSKWRQRPNCIGKFNLQLIEKGIIWDSAQAWRVKGKTKQKKKKTARITSDWVEILTSNFLNTNWIPNYGTMTSVHAGG
jgi:hypothetical protein